MTSSRPYLVRALYDWIADNQLTPHVLVNAELKGVQVPEKFVQDGRIVLNVSAMATQKLLINNEAIEFDARFGGNVWHVYVPIAAVMAIYARENGRGMVFEDEVDDDGEGGSEPPPDHPTTGKPKLRIVK
ncbi:MAG: ClpXP protease specificity-enhancing factor [Coxiellaceae bacterium]|nr:MAG: ClpXP protease specificity-enhancing factor [Coxiellaceae bacterium]